MAANNQMELLVSSLKSSFFVSGLLHREYTAGQSVKSAHAVLAELRKKRRAEGDPAGKAKRARPDPSAARGQGLRKAGKGGVSVKELLDAGLISPGHDNVTVAYKGMTYKANLLPTGAIEFEGQTFEAPSAFSVFVKRLQTPNKQGDDGWRSVHVGGVSLEDWRHQYVAQQAEAEAGVKTENKPLTQPAATSAVQQQLLQQQLQQQAAEATSMQLPQGEVNATELLPLPSSRDVLLPVEGDAEEEGEGGEEPDTNNWVQCARCQAWRVVPDNCWPEIQNSTEEDWFCKDAKWDTTQYEPFTGPCK